MKIIKKQSGEVSFFVLIFATLLFTVVTISFVRIMIQNQQQSSAVDLSVSAYDSAQAGVEDAKRALIQWKTACSTDSASIECTELTAVFSTEPINQDCNAGVSKLTDVSLTGNEVKIKTGVNNSLDQAYTCVKINTITDEYLGDLTQDASVLIPLLGTSDFDTVKIEWFSPKDYICPPTNPGCSPGNIDLPSTSDSPLLNNLSWASLPGLNRPAIMRAQLLQFNNAGYKLTDFDGGTSVVNGSNNTHFLYPSTINGVSSFATDGRLTIKNEPTKVECKSSLATVDYACSATIKLPIASLGNDHAQYLNLTSLYRKSNFKVTLWYSVSPTIKVKFNGVQPSIDSTGRANELFKRIETRVVFINEGFPFPQGAIDLNGNFCKDFSVTDIAFPGIGSGSDNTCNPQY